MKKKKFGLKPWGFFLLCFWIVFGFACAGGPEDDSSGTGESASLNVPEGEMSVSYLPGSLKGQNLIQFHLTAGKQDNQLCITCHGNKKNETATYDSRILQPHSIKMKVGGWGLKCNECHHTVDLLEGSGARLRKQVSPRICADCHGDELFPGL